MSGYNGWTNKATWAVALWIDSDGYAGGADAVLEEAKDLLESGEGDTSYVVSSLATWLQERIEDEVLGDAAGEEPKGLARDLLVSALAPVSWEEIAQSYADTAKEEALEEVEA